MAINGGGTKLGGTGVRCQSAVSSIFVWAAIVPHVEQPRAARQPRVQTPETERENERPPVVKQVRGAHMHDFCPHARHVIQFKTKNATRSTTRFSCRVGGQHVNLGPQHMVSPRQLTPRTISPGTRGRVHGGSIQVRASLPWYRLTHSGNSTN